MTKQLGALCLLALAGCFAISVELKAQVPPSPDGTYALVGATKLNSTYVSRNGDMGFCPESTPGTLSISRGQVWYVSSSGRQLIGSVSPNGEIVIRVVEARDSRPFEMDVYGVVDATGMVRARQRGNSCSYDLVWRKQS